MTFSFTHMRMNFKQYDQNCHRRLARQFYLCYRHTDDLIVFNNRKLANNSDHLANYLDLTFMIDNGGKLSARLYDKRDDFDFHIVNYHSFPTYNLTLLMVCTFRSS